MTAKYTTPIASRRQVCGRILSFRFLYPTKHANDAKILERDGRRATRESAGYQIRVNSRLALFKLCQILEHLLAVIGRLHASVNFGDFAFGINDEGVSRSEFASFVIHYRPVFCRDFRVGIGEQFEVESFLSAKILVRLSGVYAHTENYCAGVLVFRKIALKIARLHRATAGEILWIKIEHDPFAAIIFQAHLRAVSSR